MSPIKLPDAPKTNRPADHSSGAPNQRSPKGDAFSEAMTRALSGPAPETRDPAPHPSVPAEKRRRPSDVAPAGSNDTALAQLAAMSMSGQAQPVISQKPHQSNGDQDTEAVAVSKDPTATFPGLPTDGPDSKAEATETSSTDDTESNPDQAEGAISLTVQPQKTQEQQPATDLKPAPTDSKPSDQAPATTPASPPLEMAAMAVDAVAEDQVADTTTNLPVNPGADEPETGKIDPLASKTHQKPNETVAGISVAKQVAGMKNGNKTNDNSGLNEQFLPPSAGQDQADSAALRSPRPVRLAPESDWIQTPALPTQVEIVHPQNPVNFSVNLNPTPISDATLERTQEMVANHALRLSPSGDGSLQVTIRPGDGLQLSLDLRRVEGGVEVRAELSQGDFNFLSRHWADLQQQLEGRGIRLGNLGGQSNFNRDDSSRNQPSATPENQIPGAKPVSSINPISRTSSAAALRNGWEFWA